MLSFIYNWWYPPQNILTERPQTQKDMLNELNNFDTRKLRKTETVKLPIKEDELHQILRKKFEKTYL